MHIVIVNNTRIPVLKYGGTERVIWWLGQELTRAGHKVTYLVAPGSSCPFADVLPLQPGKSLDEQIPENADLVHIHFPIREPLKKPYLVTIHGNGKPGEVYDPQTVFVSKDHARRHNSAHFVYNGLGLDDYGTVDWNQKRSHWTFLAKGSRLEKNKIGAIQLTKSVREPLMIIGSRGFTFNTLVKYKGFLGGQEKLRVLNTSKGLLFPIRWHEPFGLSILESLYFGGPVLGTPYGSLPELVPSDMGVLSNNPEELTEAMNHIEDFDRKACHQYVIDRFHANQMAKDYLVYYERVMNGEQLHKTPPSSTYTRKHQLLPFGTK
ncbi:MAG: glycosyltransferase [Flavobacteriales bacterium]|nr:glycosyltransferase [Flavobacteriales bacterium]